MTRAARSVLALLLALSFLPSVLAVEEVTVRYAVGSGDITVADQRFSGPCGGDVWLEGQQVTPRPGGICTHPVTAGETVNVDVVDDALGRDAVYSVWFLTIERLSDGAFVTRGCAPRVETTGTVAVVIPEGCTHVSVRPHLGATTGIIHVW